MNGPAERRSAFAALVREHLDDPEHLPRVVELIQGGLVHDGHDLGPFGQAGDGVDGDPGELTVSAFIAAMGGDGARPVPPLPALSIDRTYRLPADQYVPEPTPKSLLVLHHTVGGSWRSTFDWWRTTPERIGTAYLVERDGAVFEVFDPRSWAYHLGLKGVGSRVDRRAIGIEICSEGGLRRGPAVSHAEPGGELYAFGSTAARSIFRGETHRVPGMGFRGFEWFAAYTEPAIESVVRLVDRLCSEHGVPRRTPADHLGFDAALFDFEGIVGHHHLRADKSDVHPGFPWAELVQRCRLEEVAS